MFLFPSIRTTTHPHCAGNFGADPQRWLFLTGSQEEIYKLISNGFRLYVKEMFGKERRPGFEIAHTNRVVLVNAKGTAVATFLATRDSDMVTLRRILEGKRPMPEPGKYGPISAPGSTEPAGDPADVDSDISDEAAADVSPPVSARESVTRTGSEHAAEAAAHSASDASREAPARAPDWVYTLPRINALLNGTATVLLAFGFVAVKRRNIATHKALMLSAFGVSIAFLTCYLIYHASLHSHTGSGSTRFEGTGIVRPVYYSILVTHVILAAAVPFLAVVTILRGLRNDIERHRGIARITFPIWLYVSVTGVIIYLMLYH